MRSRTWLGPMLDLGPQWKSANLFNKAKKKGKKIKKTTTTKKKKQAVVDEEREEEKQLATGERI